MHQVTQHWAVMLTWPLLCSLLFCSNICGPWWYSERCCEKRADRSNVYFNSSLNVSGFGSTGCKHLWPKGDMSIVGCRKGNHVCSVFLHYYVWRHFSWFHSIWFVPCLMLCCGVSRQLFPCCFYYLWLLCGRSIVGASDHRCTIAVSSTSSWFSTCGWFKSLQNLL